MPTCWSAGSMEMATSPGCKASGQRVEAVGADVLRQVAHRFARLFDGAVPDHHLVAALDQPPQARDRGKARAAPMDRHVPPTFPRAQKSSEDFCKFLRRNLFLVTARDVAVVFGLCPAPDARCQIGQRQQAGQQLRGVILADSTGRSDGRLSMAVTSSGGLSATRSAGAAQSVARS
jgi:hypothetical protein